MVLRRPLLLSACLVLSLGLAGCETSDMFDNVSESVHNFNPFGTAKKKLSGDRQRVFPDGVPGVQQGIPPELMPGGADTAATVQPEPRIAEEPKPRTRRAATRAPAATTPREAAPRRTVRQRHAPTETAAPATTATTPRQAARPAPAAGGNSSVWDAVPAQGASAPASAPAAAAPAAQGQAGWAPPPSQPAQAA
ncbi:MAG: hypothetical protein J0H62_00680, partial [Rhizobiales bacterium]|nr:hypothetical protein [Hyphomicrobiales bacterium]